MSWEIIQIDPRDVTAQKLFDIGREHKLIPDSLAQAVENYRAMASCCQVYEIFAVGENGDRPGLVASVIVSNHDGDMVNLDFVPKPAYFREGYQDKIRFVMRPLLNRLFSEYGIRRITSFIANSRPRTKRALLACGFKIEGRMRDAIIFRDQKPEDLLVMGLLKSDFLEVRNA